MPSSIPEDLSDLLRSANLHTVSCIRNDGKVCPLIIGHVGKDDLLIPIDETALDPNSEQRAQFFSLLKLLFVAHDISAFTFINDITSRFVVSSETIIAIVVVGRSGVMVETLSFDAHGNIKPIPVSTELVLEADLLGLLPQGSVTAEERRQAVSVLAEHGCQMVLLRDEQPDEPNQTVH